VVVTGRRFFPISFLRPWFLQSSRSIFAGGESLMPEVISSVFASSVVAGSGSCAVVDRRI
jgi:hypothetical protein